MLTPVVLFTTGKNTLRAVAFSLLILGCSVASLDAQNRALQRPRPGEKIKGSEHPEYFSNAMAFRVVMSTLAIHPDDALRCQRRARHLEQAMSLSDIDTQNLEAIVEGLRIRELKIDDKVRLLRGSFIQKPEDFSALNRERSGLLRDAARLVVRNLSVSGRQSVKAYMAEIVSKSTVSGFANRPKKEN